MEMEEFEKAHSYRHTALAQNPPDPSPTPLLRELSALKLPYNSLIWTEKIPCTASLNPLVYGPVSATAVPTPQTLEGDRAARDDMRAVSSAGRAPRSQRGGRGFESLTVHHHPPRIGTQKGFPPIGAFSSVVERLLHTPPSLQEPLGK
jgi:hypothetical protein